MGYFKKLTRDENRKEREREIESVRIWGISKNFAYDMPSREKYIFHILFGAFYITSRNIITYYNLVNLNSQFQVHNIQNKQSTYSHFVVMFSFLYFASLNLNYYLNYQGLSHRVGRKIQSSKTESMDWKIIFLTLLVTWIKGKSTDCYPFQTSR